MGQWAIRFCQHKLMNLTDFTIKQKHASSIVGVAP